MSSQRIDQETALDLINNENAMVVDIRDPASFQSGRIKGARHLDNQGVSEFIAGTDTDHPVIVCCYHGNASQGAAEFLTQQGFSRCFSLDGGFHAWRLAGHPED
jgi:thiosulfate sulfurtransferase